MNYTLYMNEISFLKAIDLLSKPTGVTIDELKNGLSISRRSVYRLIERLENLGYPLYCEEGKERKKYWFLEERFLTKLPNINLPNLNLDKREVLLLNLILSSNIILEDSEYERTQKSLRSKLTKWLEASDNSHDKNIYSGKHITSLKNGYKSYLGSEKILEDMLIAIENHKVCSVVYYAFSKRKEYLWEIHPLHIYEWNRGLYLFCLIEPGLPQRMLPIERFNELIVTDKSFPDPSIDTDQILGNSFGVIWDDPIEVQIRFSAQQAPYMKVRKWSENQVFTDSVNGSTILKMKTSGTDDLIHWILSFGNQAEVIEPKWLKENVIGQMESSLKLYQAGNS